MIVAFFVTSWAAFVFLIVAYWSGLLPQSLLRPVDIKLFGANSRRYHSEWRESLVKVTLLFSDQQLLTGIGILLAGYYEVFARNLDALDWHIVTYLAWMSSTVHLITLSLLKDRLNEHKTLRNLRLTGMLVLLALLLVALAPSVSLYFVNSYNFKPGEGYNSPGYTGIGTGAAIPTKCFYGYGYGELWQPYRGVSRNTIYGIEGQSVSYSSSSSYVAVPAIVAYITLILSYIWKVTQLFDTSLNWFRRNVRYLPEARLERAAKRILMKESTSWYNHCMYLLTKSAYLTFCVIADVLESFGTTNLVLFFTLTWGTLQVVLPRTWLIQATNIDETFSFGQILPLMLLLQPVAAIVAHYVGK